MKKMIAFGTAVSLLAATAVVVSASTDVKTSISLDFGVDDDAGTLTVIVTAENAGETGAYFSVTTQGLAQSDVVFGTNSNTGPNEGEFFITKPGNAPFSAGEVICQIVYNITDPDNYEIEIEADEDLTDIVGNNAFSVNDKEDSGDSGSSVDPETSDSETSDSETSDSKPNGDSETDSSGSSGSSSDAGGDSDGNVHTGVGLAVIPVVLAAAGAVVAKKKK